MPHYKGLLPSAAGLLERILEVLAKGVQAWPLQIGLSFELFRTSGFFFYTGVRHRFLVSPNYSNYNKIIELLTTSIK